MAKGLTDTAIQNLKAGDTRREIPDPGCAGLYCIVQTSGRKSFAVRYRFNGQPRKLTLTGGLTLAAARKLAGDALSNFPSTVSGFRIKQLPSKLLLPFRRFKKQPPPRSL